jgi:dienelactone hydrolase
MKPMLALAAVILLACPAAAAGTPSVGPAACHVAAYRLSDGRLLDLSPSLNKPGLRWRLLDGRVGRFADQEDGAWVSRSAWGDAPDGVRAALGACGEGRIRFEGVEGRAVDLEVTDTSFRSGSETLKGRLVLPKGAGRVPIAVVGHGSERDPYVGVHFRQRLYPAAGVGVFVFDKRGTGGSTGKYTQDFHVLSADAVAAMAEARRLAGRRAGRVGFLGGSQAGWILPLAATKTKADFVIVGYGVAASPLAEDRTETLQDLAAKGWGPDVLKKALEVTDATSAVMAARFRGGYEQLNAVVAKYRGEPWFKDLAGEYTGRMVQHSEAALREIGPTVDVGTTWDHDAVGVLRKLDTPLLWMIAADDTGGAGQDTEETLLALAAQGRPITVASFPATDHGLLEYRLDDKGERVSTRYAEGFFQMELDFARKGRLSGPYGRAKKLTNPMQR